MSQKSLTHQVGILTAGRIIAYAAMFFVPLVNTRTLSVEDYGYYRQFWLLVETLVPMLVLAFPRSLQYYLPRADTRHQAASYVSHSVLALSGMAVVGILVCVVMGETLGEGMGSMVRLFMWPLCLFTFVKVTTEFMEVLFIAERKVVAQSAYHAATWGLQAILVMAVSYLTGDVLAVIWAVAAFALLRFLFVMGYIQAAFGFTFRRISPGTLRDLFSFALPVGIAAITITLLNQTDKFIITRYLGREQFAIYTVGAFQVPLMNLITASISSVTFPLMVSYEKTGDHAGVLGLWQRSLLKTTVLILPVFVFLEITARPFVTILFTSKYAAATPVFMLYLLLFLRSSFEATMLLQVYKRARYVVATSAAGFVVNLALGLVLVKSVGRLGPPVAAVITLSLLNLVHLWYSARLMHATLHQMLPVAALGKRFAAALAPGVVLWLACRRIEINELHQLVLACAAYTVLYAAVCAVTRIVTVDDVRALLGKARTRATGGSG